MILVLSKQHEQNTDQVIEWLSFYKVKYYRLNYDSINLDEISFKLSNKGNEYKSLPFDPEKIRVVWYRRWGRLLENSSSRLKELDKGVEDSITFHLESEKKGFLYFFYSLFEHCEWLSLPQSYSIHDKFLTLQKAKKLGIKIPDTYLINNKDDLKEVLKNNSLITKNIREANKIKFNNKTYIPYTSEVKYEDLKFYKNSFFVSLFQEKVEKEFEIRSFYLNGNFFSMAIFSQNDEKTKLDYRKYNIETPNRTVPYLLSKKMKDKLQLLMKELNLKCASIDLIQAKNKELFFLEVNPVGQFGMTSFPCNFNLEKEIAKELIKLNNNGKSE